MKAGRRTIGAAAACGLSLAACANNPYVIGRYRDTSCDAHPDALLCSGFEEPDLSDWNGTVVAGAASVAQTDTRSRDGLGSLRADSQAQESEAVVAREFPPVTGGDLFVRLYAFVPSGSPTKTMNILFLGDYAAPDPFKGIDFNLESDAPQIYVPESQPPRYTSMSALIPRDRWFCFRVHVALSATAGTVELWIDDAPALAQSGLHTLPAAGIHLLRAGVDWSSLQNDPFTLYLDDLVLATTPVACD